MIDVSIIIVSYNTKKLLLDCLESLRKHTKEIDYEVIVVDNGSTDGTVAMLQKLKDKQSLLLRGKSEKLKVIENRENLGFAAANNQGIKMASGRFILLLNSDTKLSENTLLKVIMWMEKRPNVGVASCKLANPNGTLQPTGGNFPDLFHVFLWTTFLDDIPGVSLILGSYHPHAFGFWYRNERQVDWVTGAFLMARREVFEKVGLLDESFFMYGEDVEFCLRAKKKGFGVWYNPKTQIIHLGGGSLPTRSQARLGELVGLIMLYKKHYPAWQLPILRLFLFLGVWARITVFGIISRQKAKEYVSALGEI